jgi:transposase
MTTADWPLIISLQNRVQGRGDRRTEAAKIMGVGRTTLYDDLQREAA